MKKYFKLLMFSFICLFCFGITKVNAYTLSVTFIETGRHDLVGLSTTPDAKWNIYVVGGTTNFDALSKLVIDNNMVTYCIEPHILTEHGETYTDGNINSVMNTATLRQLEKIAYLGYGYSGDTSNEMYAATQIRIWQALGWTIQSIHADIQAKINTINTRLKIFDSMPSFNKQKVVFDPEKTGQENAITLTDENGVFHLYKNENSDFNFSRNGDTLKIWRSEDSSLEGDLSFRLVDEKDVGESRAFLSSTGKQKLGFFRMADPYRVNVLADTAYIKVRISKQDITTGKEIAGSKLNIKDQETGDLIDEWVSDETVHEIDGDKFENGKEYILHEETAPNGYHVAQDITFTYNRGKMETIVMSDEKIVENPNTGISSPYLLGGVGILVVGAGIIILNKKNKFKRI